MKLNDALEACGIIAILRGVTPAEVIDVSTALYESGIRIVEVPLNSPEPFVSIRKLAETFKGRMVVGAGTVLTEDNVVELKSAGGTISVSPDCNPHTIAKAVALGLDPLPGVFTPTEAFAALRAGASQLKLFPAEVASPQTIKAWKAVLPKHVKIHAVGGVTPANMSDWIKAGAAGFGIGSSLYKPGATLDHVKSSAAELVAAWQKAKS